MTEVLTTFGVGLASALIPLINIEIYLSGLVAAQRVGPGQAIALADRVGRRPDDRQDHLVRDRLAQHGAARWVKKKLAQDKWKLSYAEVAAADPGTTLVRGSIIFAAAFLGVPAAARAGGGRRQSADAPVGVHPDGARGPGRPVLPHPGGGGSLYDILFK